MDDLLDVHVGTHAPAKWDRIEEQQAEWPEESRQARPRIASEQLPWEDAGLRPRWVGDDTSQAVAAIDPCIYHGRGADELERFVRGTRQRSELAVHVWSFGDLENDQPSPLRGVYFAGDDSVHFPRIDEFWVSGTLIRVAGQPVVADGISGADRDLALRLARRSLELPWWSLQVVLQQAGAFFGTWTPLLTTAAGEVLAGVWTDNAEAGDDDRPLERHYVVPALPSYRPVLQWLAERAIPELVPNAARRSRRYVAEVPELQTTQEQRLVQQLDDLARNYEQERARLTTELAAERDRAEQVREPLLFGTGADLEAAVALVLRAAGLRVTALDPQLGTKSADLLLEMRGRRLLLEVKSSSGRPSEALVDAARRHLRTWPQLRGDTPVGGVALVVNHQHRQPPGDRTPLAYERREFVDSLNDVTVVTTLQLFDWWRQSQWAEIRAVFGHDAGEPASTAGSLPQTEPAGATRPWWRRRR
ncbi:hypothetical protein [Cellulomonas marina]|nr:hypothetical protein [Cellulomonas marina]